MDTSHAYYLTIIDLVPKLSQEHAQELCNKLKCHLELLNNRHRLQNGKSINMDTKMDDLNLSVRTYSIIDELFKRCYKGIPKELIDLFMIGSNISQAMIFKIANNKEAAQQSIDEINKLLEPFYTSLKQ